MLALSNYHKKTPANIKFWGDVMLFSAPLLSGAIMAAPLSDVIKSWAVFGLNVLLVLGKILTKFAGEEVTDIIDDTHIE